MEHAYATLNKRIADLWATIAPETVSNNGPPRLRFPLVVGKPKGNQLPPECLRVYWFGSGEPTGVPGELLTTVQLDFYTLGDELLAMRKTKALEDALGFKPTAPFVPLQVNDYTGPTPRPIGQMRLLHQGRQWLDIPDPDERALHRARRFDVAWLY